MKQIVVRALALIFVPFLFAFPSWQRPSEAPPASGEWRSLLRDPRDPAKLIASSARQIFEETADGTWKNLWPAAGPGLEIRRILSFKEMPGVIFALTQDGIYRGNLALKNWSRVWRGNSAQEKSVLSFQVMAGEPDHWFAGTEAGLFESDDSGKTWGRFARFGKAAIPTLGFSENWFFVATRKNLYAAEDLSDFRMVFSLSGSSLDGPLETLTTGHEEAALEAAETAGTPLALREFIRPAQSEGLIWLATERGVFESRDNGKRWHPLPQSGLRSRDIRHLVWSEKSRRLFAGTPEGIYAYRPEAGRWGELFQGLERTDTKALILLGGEKEFLAAATGGGLFRYPILPDGLAPAFPEMIPPERAMLFRELARLEPSARETQQAAIRYANVRNAKIRRWQAGSRLKTLFPSLSFGRNLSRARNIDIDRGGTSDRDQFIAGPDEISRKWDANLSWDLGDMIWSSDQTSIDSREKLMVELRSDLLGETTRTYYERRRLQMEIIFQPAASESEHLEKLLRMDELTSLLDGLTDGFFTTRLDEIYADHPNLNKLWERQPPPYNQV